MSATIIPFPAARRIAAMRYGKQASAHVRDLLRDGHSSAMALNDAKRKFDRQGKSFPKDAA